MKKGIFINGKLIITPITISTICGHWGTGLMPLAFRPDYLSFLKLIRETKTTELAKFSTYKFRRGNFIWFNPYKWKYAQRISHDSMLNAYSHTNLGIEINAKMMAFARNLGFNIVPNFAPDFSKNVDGVFEEIRFAVKLIIKYGFRIIEIVPSCQNRKYDVKKNVDSMAICLRRIKAKYPQLIIIVKKGLQHPTEAVQEWELAGMDILHGINAVPYANILPNKISPLQNVGGGTISGTIVTEVALKDNIKSRKAYSGPMIFGGGIGNVDQALKCFDCGANAVSNCTGVRYNMPEAKKMIKKFNL